MGLNVVTLVLGRRSRSYVERGSLVVDALLDETHLHEAQTLGVPDGVQFSKRVEPRRPARLRITIERTGPRL